MKRKSNEPIKEVKTMKKTINILSIMICLTMFNSITTKNDVLGNYGMHEIGCGKYEYTNNSTVPEVPKHFLETS